MFVLLLIVFCYKPFRALSTIFVMNMDGPVHYRAKILGHHGNETGVGRPQSFSIDPVRG